MEHAAVGLPNTVWHTISHFFDLVQMEICGEMLIPGGMTGANAGDNTYVFYGSFDKDGLEQLGPKGEFFTKYRQKWNPPVPDTFQKKEIKE